MSRSYRKRPFFSYTKDKRASEKADKRIANKRLRAAFRQALYHDPECELPPLMNEVSNLYDFPSDGGKHWRGNMKYPRWDDFWQCWDKWHGPEYYKKLMRK